MGDLWSEAVEVLGELVDLKQPRATLGGAQTVVKPPFHRCQNGALAENL